MRKYLCKPGEGVMEEHKVIKIFLHKQHLRKLKKGKIVSKMVNREVIRIQLLGQDYKIAKKIKLLQYKIDQLKKSVSVQEG